MTLGQHVVPGTAAGFIYQFERALYWLAQSPKGFVVGIETDDDVAIQGSDGTSVLEQNKHSIQKGAKPFSDRSLDLWKTLSIWIQALVDGQVPPDKIRFLMVTNKSLTDNLAKRIGNAITPKEIDTCIAELENIGKSPSETIKAHVKTVLNPTSRNFLKVLIKKCELYDASNSAAGAELQEKIISELQIPEWCSAFSDSIVDELTGWLKRCSIELWRQGKPAWIERNHFINQLHSILDYRKRKIKRERAENLIPVGDEKVGEQKGRPFVKQIFLVTDDEDIVDSSIREFIRCNLEKIRLSQEGNLTDNDWKDFESKLHSRWKKIYSRIKRVKKIDPEEDVGFEIFTETTEDHREILAGTQTEQIYLTAGTYHRLADAIKLGWHPRYKDLMT